MLTEEQNLRYNRHLRILGFTARDQEKILNASVLVIGAGGLGSPVLQYLCAAGVGHITIVDNDVVDVSNLQRQVLYTEADEGQYKADKTGELLKARNSSCSITVHKTLWEPSNATELAENCDMIVDCTDNYHSRLTTDEVSKKLGIPFIFGAINGWEGQVSVFNFEGGKSYSEAFGITRENIPEIDGPIGVLGVTPAITGSMQAAEVIKIITGQGDVLSGKLLLVSIKSNSYQLMAF
jgi:adenylyltransferase/sulfurtransferase